MRIASLIAAGLVLQAQDLAAAEPRCAGNPSLVGSCYPVSGTYTSSADAAMVLWPRDNRSPTIRIRALREGEADIPANLARTMEQAMSDHGPTAEVQGNFVVCPVASTDPVHRDEPAGCIETAANLVTVAPRPAPRPPKPGPSHR